MRKSWPQLGQALRWKLRSRMAVRRSGRRTALTLCTSSNGTDAWHDGQAVWTVWKIDMRRSWFGFGPGSAGQLGQPAHRRVVVLQLLALPGRVQLGEPLARRAELV